MLCASAGSGVVDGVTADGPFGCAVWAKHAEPKLAAIAAAISGIVRRDMGLSVLRAHAGRAEAPLKKPICGE